MIIVNYSNKIEDGSLTDDELIRQLNRDVVRHRITDSYYKENASSIMMSAITESMDYDYGYHISEYVPEKTAPEEVLAHLSRDTDIIKVYKTKNTNTEIEIDVRIAEFELIESMFKTINTSLDDIMLTTYDEIGTYKNVKYADLKLIYTKEPAVDSFYSRPYVYTMKHAIMKNARGEYTIDCVPISDELLISDSNINEFISCANIKTYDELKEFTQYLYFAVLSGDADRVLEPLFIHMTNVISHSFMDEDMWIYFSTVFDDTLLSNVKATWNEQGYPDGFIGYMKAIDVKTIDNVTIENVVGFLLCLNRELDTRI